MPLLVCVHQCPNVKKNNYLDIFPFLFLGGNVKDLEDLIENCLKKLPSFRKCLLRKNPSTLQEHRFPSELSVGVFQSNQSGQHDFDLVCSQEILILRTKFQSKTLGKVKILQETVALFWVVCGGFLFVVLCCVFLFSFASSGEGIEFD